jgi:hypothetical protein
MTNYQTEIRIKVPLDVAEIIGMQPKKNAKK